MQSIFKPIIKSPKINFPIHGPIFWIAWRWKEKKQQNKATKCKFHTVFYLSFSRGDTSREGKLTWPDVPTCAMLCYSTMPWQTAGLIASCLIHRARGSQNISKDPKGSLNPTHCFSQHCQNPNHLTKNFSQNCSFSARNLQEDGKPCVFPRFLLLKSDPPLAPDRYFNFTQVLRRCGSKHEKINWKNKILKLLFAEEKAEEKTGTTFTLLASDTNKVSWRQIQVSKKQELPWCLWKTKLTGWQDHFPPAYMHSSSLLEWEATPSGLKITCPENHVFVPQSSAHVKNLHSSFLAHPLGHWCS